MNFFSKYWPLFVMFGIVGVVYYLARPKLYQPEVITLPPPRHRISLLSEGVGTFDTSTHIEGDLFELTPLEFTEADVPSDFGPINSSGSIISLVTAVRNTDELDAFIETIESRGSSSELTALTDAFTEAFFEDQMLIFYYANEATLAFGEPSGVGINSDGVFFLVVTSTIYPSGEFDRPTVIMETFRILSVKYPPEM